MMDEKASCSGRVKLWLKAKLFVTALALAYVNSQDISACCSKAAGSCLSVCEKRPRVSQEQRRMMMEYMMRHPDFARGRVAGSDAARRRASIMDEMASLLNAVGSGASKTPEKWWKMSLTDLVTKPKETFIEERITNIYKFCSPSLVEFWICMNHTIQEVVTGTGWWGHACCALARSASCRKGCAGAMNASSLTDVCRRSDEIEFFDCVQRQREAQWCCSKTQSPKCHQACRKELWRVNNTIVESDATERLARVCHQSPDILACFNELAGPADHVDTSKYISCCQEVDDAKCRRTCETTLRTVDDIQTIERVLENDCGPPAFDSPLWLCFLKNDQHPDPKDLIPYDVAKLHCCEKASTINCKKICFETFNNGWQSNWQRFHLECLGDSQEVYLAECIEEVNAPCSLGCAGLRYCTQLNNRPDTLFRSCSAQADDGAYLAIKEQKDSGVVSVLDLQLPLKNSSHCPTDVWRSVACALHVKPCTTKGHSTLLCKEDCLRLVSSCVEWSRVPPQNLTAMGLCARLTPRDANAPCVPLRQYMTPSTEPALLSASEAVTSPCAGAPCGESQVCIVNRDCLQGDSCPRYRCVDGCRLGENSPYMVPVGSWVRIQMSLHNHKWCYKVCNCTRKGLAHCQPLPCVEKEDCVLHDKVVKHGEKYYIECNECACVLGERVCARRACGRATLLTGLPCNCPAHHLPVRARHNNYPNACLAKCSGATDAEVEFAAPPSRSCGGAPCTPWRKCLPLANVCLSKLQYSCPQQFCLNPNDDCENHPSMPICDTDGRTHANPCYLLNSPGKRMAYWGPCLKRCSNNGTVCGVNGITYNSECAAWADFVTIDYFGPCYAVGPISKTMEPKCIIDRILCPPLKRSNCAGFTPPGACCPKCGGGIRILYSQKQIDRALYGTNISASVINLQNIMKALDRHVKIAECALRGYLTIEMEIFISVETILQNPTDLQLKVCVLEAEKIADMINRQSVLITSDLGLSALAYALPVHTYMTQGAVTISLSLFTFSLTILISLLR